ncbi:MAG: homoserine O-succinyltransferase, partial [Sebaldella sp.]|nr:homoserine O-succinyltransferase [Sebaldella sp.]
YISGHMEYAKYNLRDEYIRDIKKGIVIEKPENYFLENDINKEPVFSWDSFSREFYKNWLGSI